MMPTLTIYTPTYNRATLLPRVYASLCRQTCEDFLWLVIDDGSTDNTEELVQGWIDENKIEIRYIFKENGGVHTARDLAYHVCKTELIVSCDSDDWFVDDAVENIISCWEMHNKDNYAGIFAPNVTPNGKLISQFPQIESATYQEFTYKYHFCGDKQSVLRSSIIAQIPDAPVFEGEKLIGEGYKWIQLPEDRPFIVMQQPISVVDYQPYGISANTIKNRFKNPNGFRASAKQSIVSCKYLKPRIKAYLSYIAYSFILKDKAYIKNSPKPSVTFLLTPLGFVVYLRFLYQKKRLNGG